MTAPLDSKARLCWYPAESATAPVRSTTCTGTLLEPDVSLPSPSWPSSFSPQELAVPLDISASTCCPPAATAVTPASPLTATGTSLLVYVPSPSSPLPL